MCPFVDNVPSIIVSKHGCIEGHFDVLPGRIVSGFLSRDTADLGFAGTGLVVAKFNVYAVVNSFFTVGVDRLLCIKILARIGPVLIFQSVGCGLCISQYVGELFVVF